MNKNIKIFLALLITGVVIGATFLFRTENNTKHTPAQTAVQTSNWKTYTSSKYGFEFKYPSSLRLFDDKNSVRVMNDYPDGILIAITKYNTAEDNLDSWWAKSGKDFTNEIVAKTQFKDRSAYFIKDSQKEVKQGYSDGYVIQMDGYLLNITYAVPYNLDFLNLHPDKNYQTFNESFKTEGQQIDQILSTFKFTTPTTSSDTSNWTLYTNKAFGYSIKFPTTYQVPPQTEKLKNQFGFDVNIGVERKSEPGSKLIAVSVSTDKDDMYLEDYMNKSLKSLGYADIVHLVSYNFNRYDSLLYTSPIATNVFLKRGHYIYNITADKTSSDNLNKEVSDILTTFKFTQ